MNKRKKVRNTILIVIGILLFTVLILMICFLKKDGQQDNYEEWRAPKEMANATTFHDTTLEIQDESLTNTSATFIIKTPYSDSKSYVGYDEYYYRIFKKILGKWKELTPLDLYKNRQVPLGKEPSNDGIYVFDINWEEDYGYLEKGIYKLCIPVTYSYFFESSASTDSGYIGVEFEIK